MVWIQDGHTPKLRSSTPADAFLNESMTEWFCLYYINHLASQSLVSLALILADFSLPSREEKYVVYKHTHIKLECIPLHCMHLKYDTNWKLKLDYVS